MASSPRALQPPSESVLEKTTAETEQCREEPDRRLDELDEQVRAVLELVQDAEPEVNPEEAEEGHRLTPRPPSTAGRRAPR